MDTPLLPFLVDRLRRLQGLSFRELSEIASISSPSNLREWVLGLPARLSAVRIDRVLKASGLDPVTGTLLPGLHRWRTTPSDVELLKDVLPLLFPDRLEMGRARGPGPVRQYSWILLVRGPVQVLITLEGSNEEELRALFASLRPSLSTNAPTLPPERILSDIEAASLFEADLSAHALDHLFDLPSKRDPSWTYERLFERMWADGIEPSEAARRLGFF